MKTKSPKFTKNTNLISHVYVWTTLIVNWKLFEMGVKSTMLEGFKLAGKGLKSSKQSLPGTATTLIMRGETYLRSAPEWKTSHSGCQETS